MSESFLEGFNTHIDSFENAAALRHAPDFGRLALSRGYYLDTLADEDALRLAQELFNDPREREAYVTRTLLDAYDTQAQREQGENAALLDYLTEMPNRNGLAKWAAKYGIGEDDIAVAVDLTRFKRVNDRVGHITGDGVLIEAKTELHCLLDEELTDHDSVRPDETGHDPVFMRQAHGIVARTGGDEFTVIVKRRYLSERYRNRLTRGSEADLADMVIAQLEGRQVYVFASGDEAVVARASQDDRPTDEPDYVVGYRGGVAIASGQESLKTLRESAEANQTERRLLKDRQAMSLARVALARLAKTNTPIGRGLRAAAAVAHSLASDIDPSLRRG